MRAGRWLGVAMAAGVAAGAAAADPAPAAPAGNPLVGRELFIGARRFQAGGPPCGVCHGIGGEGLAFSASLGPELSSSVAGLDPESLQGVLETLPFPTMVPLYTDRALTPGERADLGAFLVEAAKAAGVWIPVLCNYEGLKPAGSCRICTVDWPGWNRESASSAARCTSRSMVR